ncbi:hypothetical protein [Azospirillum sp. Marseille-Q6669]
MSPPDILIAVEDPGAANFAALLPERLAALGHSVRLVATGPAVAHLRTMGVDADRLPDGDPGDLLVQYRPRLLLAGTSENPDSPVLSMIAAARASGIRSGGLVDASTNLDRRFRGRGGDPLAFLPDGLLVPDDTTRQGFLALGVAESRVVVTGHPRYDTIRGERQRLSAGDRRALRRRLFPERPPGRRIVLFAAERSDGLDAGQFTRSPDYTLTGDGGHDGRTEIVAEEVLRAVASHRDRIHLVLRLHPKNDPADLAHLRERFDAVSQGGPSLNVLHASDLVVGMTSMLLVEAALLGRPVACVLPRAVEATWLPLATAGVVPVATTRRAAKRALRAQIETPAAVDATTLECLFPSGALDRAAAAAASLIVTGANAAKAPD